MDDAGPDRSARNAPETDCAVVGGGPGGMLLAYLLARAGIQVTLLEAHADFDRDFRGDSLHPYTLELLDELGLAEDLLALQPRRAGQFRLHTPAGSITTADYTRLPTRFPYVALLPQAQFLDLLAAKAAELPTFHLRTGTRVRSLCWEAGRVTGVGWRTEHGEQQLSARLVVGVDGRFSRMRRLAELPAESLGARSDLLWFRLPRRPDDPPHADLDLHFGHQHYVALIGGNDTWQVGYTLPKGGYQEAKAAGVGPIQEFLARHVSWLADRAPLLTDFAQTTLLSVDIARTARWYRPGALLLGDAAHVISPVGGNGILMAVQDAVAAANLLVPTLRNSTEPVPTEVLAAVQRSREPSIRQVQEQQVSTERRVAAAREANRAVLPSRLLKLVTRLPGARTRNARANAYGPNPPQLDPGVLAPG